MENQRKGRGPMHTAVWVLTMASLLIAPSLLFLEPNSALGQGLPPRGYTVMRTNPIVPAIQTPAQYLRQDIVRSTNPVSGTLNVSQFAVRTSTLPGSAELDQNAVTTQYLKRRGTLPGNGTDPDRVTTQTRTRRSTFP